MTPSAIRPIDPDRPAPRLPRDGRVQSFGKASSARTKLDPRVCLCYHRRHSRETNRDRTPMDTMLGLSLWIAWSLIFAIWCHSLAEKCGKRNRASWAICGVLFNIVPVIALYAALPPEGERY